MKLYIVILGISLSSFFSAYGMLCGGKVTKKIKADTASIRREVITQTNEEKGIVLVVKRTFNKETESVSYSGKLSNCVDAETVNHTSLGECDDKDNAEYKLLENFWLKLNVNA